MSAKEREAQLVSIWFPDHNFRTWLVRRLIRIAVRLDPDTPFVQQADEHWQLNRRWTQPVGGAEFREHLEREHNA